MSRGRGPDVLIGRVRSACLLMVATLAIGCAPRGPVVGSSPTTEGVGGTIAGRVDGSGGTALSGRRVTAINESSGARFDVTTATNGGYTLKVPAGTYRLEVELRPGEAVDRQPDPTEVNVGDLDPDRNFVLTVR